MTTTWLGSGRGICSPLVAFPGTPRGSESPSPCLPGCGSATRLSVLAPVSASSPWVLRGAPPFPSDSISPRQLGARPLPAAALTSGTRKPLRVFLCVQPKGRASPSSYSAGSQRASALLAAPSAGLLLKWQGWPSASAGQLLGLLVRTPQGIPPGKDGSLCPRETGCGGGASEVCGGLDHSHPRRLGGSSAPGKGAPSGRIYGGLFRQVGKVRQVGSNRMASSGRWPGMVRPWESCLSCSRGQAPGWAARGRWANLRATHPHGRSPVITVSRHGAIRAVFITFHQRNGGSAAHLPGECSQVQARV